MGIKGFKNFTNALAVGVLFAVASLPAAAGEQLRWLVFEPDDSGHYAHRTSRCHMGMPPRPEDFTPNTVFVPWTIDPSDTVQRPADYYRDNNNTLRFVPETYGSDTA